MIIHDENVTKLQGQVKEIMPLLDKNLGLTYHAYMHEGLAHGAFCYVLGRHEQAALIANIDQVELKDNATPELIFKSASSLFIDLRAMVNDLSGQDKTEAEEKIAGLKQLFHDNGFTAEHPWFKTPVKPVAASEMQPV